MKAVQVEKITKKYGARMVLHDVSFAVEEGEFVALVGPSGCGKSTILNMIGVLETYDSGKIQIMGEYLPPINSRRATKLRRNIINYLFQSFALISDLTVYQNLFLAMNFVNMSTQKKNEQIKNMLTAVHLFPLVNAVVNTLSGGEQQRVALARTMVKPGNLILADEPTGSLDVEAAEISFSFIRSLAKEHGKSVMMVTHSPQLANRADRIIDLAAFHSP